MYISPPATDSTLSRWRSTLTITANGTRWKGTHSGLGCQQQSTTTTCFTSAPSTTSTSPWTSSSLPTLTSSSSSQLTCFMLSFPFSLAITSTPWEQIWLLSMQTDCSTGWTQSHVSGQPPWTRKRQLGRLGTWVRFNMWWLLQWVFLFPSVACWRFCYKFDLLCPRTDSLTRVKRRATSIAKNTNVAHGNTSPHNCTSWANTKMTSSLSRDDKGSIGQSSD